MAELVLRQSELGPFIEETLKQAYSGAQEAQRKLGLPVYAIETLEVTVTLLKNDGLSAAFTEDEQVNPTTITRRQQPTTRTTRTGKGKAEELSKAEDTGKNIESDLTEGSNVTTGTDTSSDTATDTSNNSSTGTTDQTTKSERLTNNQTYT